MAGGKLLALDIGNGAVIWEATVAVPSGRSELGRLADIDGVPLVSDGLVYASTYQGQVAALGEYSGSVLWRRKFSSYTSMAADRYKVYASDADGYVWALSADNGSARWSQQDLRNRQLSDVAVLGNVVAVGDFEGYVHFLSTEDGSLIGRTRVGNKPVRGGMLVVDDKLYVQDGSGDLEVLRLRDNR
jgi:outer membrane protein assembly factor BamB